MRRGSRAGILALGLALVVGATPVGAQPEPPDRATGEADTRQHAGGGAEVRARTTVETPPEEGRGTLPRRTAPIITVVWRPTGVYCPFTPDATFLRDGWERVRVDRSFDPPREVVVARECRPPPDPRPQAADAPDPTRVADAAAARLAPPTLTANPDGSQEIPGITGLETWFWYDGPLSRTVVATVDGYQTTATLRPVAWRWWPCWDYRPPETARHKRPRGCDRATVLTSTVPGSRPPPGSDGAAAAARFTYETSGSYTARLQVVWHGAWTFTAGGVTTNGGDLGPVTTATTSDYLVMQIRSILLPDPQAT